VPSGGSCPAIELWATGAGRERFTVFDNRNKGHAVQLEGLRRVFLVDRVEEQWSFK
jgi:hypothetical protein